MSHRIVRTAAAAVMMIGLAACSGSGSDSEGRKPPEATFPPSPTPSIGTLGAAGCQPASPLSKDGEEVQGTPTESGMTLYGLLQLTPEQSRKVGIVMKVVWRMPGDDLAVRLIGPDGSETKPAWGPEEHGGSTYHRPGNEWGTGIKFDKPGCWEIRMSTTKGHASVWLDVAA